MNDIFRLWAIFYRKVREVFSPRAQRVLLHSVLCVIFVSLAVKTKELFYRKVREVFSQGALSHSVLCVIFASLAVKTKEFFYRKVRKVFSQRAQRSALCAYFVPLVVKTKMPSLQKQSIWQLGKNNFDRFGGLRSR